MNGTAASSSVLGPTLVLLACALCTVFGDIRSTDRRLRTAQEQEALLEYMYKVLESTKPKVPAHAIQLRKRYPMRVGVGGIDIPDLIFVSQNDPNDSTHAPNSGRTLPSANINIQGLRALLDRMKSKLRNKQSRPGAYIMGR